MTDQTEITSLGLDLMVADAEKRFRQIFERSGRTSFHDAVGSIAVSSRPQMYGSTTGPFAGYGGSAMTWCQTSVVRCDLGLVAFSDGQWILTIDDLSTETARKVFDTCRLPSRPDRADLFSWHEDFPVKSPSRSRR